jgi:hypothetical protein
LIRPDFSGRVPQIGDDPRRDVVDAYEERKDVVLLKNELPNKVLVECHEGDNLDVFIFPDNNAQPMNIILKVETLIRIIKRRNGMDLNNGQPEAVQVGDGMKDFDRGNVVIEITEDDLFPRR